MNLQEVKGITLGAKFKLVTTMLGTNMVSKTIQKLT